MTLDRDNNFDLIRLLAAVQVLTMHGIAWLNVPLSPLAMEVADWFPGVPIFFVISGCLVTASFSRAPSAREYMRNRALRIFPGLWICLIVSYALVAARGELADNGLVLRTIAWFAANGTLFQFTGAFGTGVINGALWSISTELQFYILVPVFGVLVTRVIKSRATATALVVTLVILSGFIHQQVLLVEPGSYPWAYPALYASIFANGFLFLLGVLAYLWREWLLKIVKGRVVIIVVAYLTIRAAIAAVGVSANAVHSSMLAILVYPLLALAVFSTAFSFAGMSRQILAGNDYSYGLYIYHMPVVYALIHYDVTGYAGFILMTLLVTVFATSSWFFIERPALRLKHYTATGSVEPVASPFGTT